MLFFSIIKIYDYLIFLIERNSSRHSESYPFAIDTFSGRITTISQLDREIRLAYYLTVLAYAEATPAVVSSAEVSIVCYVLQSFVFVTFSASNYFVYTE